MHTYINITDDVLYAVVDAVDVVGLLLLFYDGGFYCCAPFRIFSFRVSKKVNEFRKRNHPRYQRQQWSFFSSFVLYADAILLLFFLMSLISFLF